MKTTQPLLKLSAALLFATTIAGQANAGEGFSVTTGARDRSSASDLFVTPDSRILPISASFETEHFVYTGTVSYLQVNGLRGVPDYDYRWVKSARNDSGTPLADFVAQDVDTSLTYKVRQTLQGGWSLDVTCGLRFINGDLLNTKAILKNYSLQLAFTREFGQFTAETGMGYRLRDNPEGFNYQSSANGYVGGGYQFSLSTKVEMYLDVRQAAKINSSNEAEVTAYFSHQLPTKNLSLQTYAFKGLSQQNHNLETGLMLKMRF